MAFTVVYVLTKLQRWCFALAWRLFMLLYCAIGLGAMAVLFLIEAQFFMQMTQHEALGYGIATILEVTKVGTSLIKQAVSIAGGVYRLRISSLVQTVTFVLQIVLVLVTLFASLAVVTSYLDGRALQGGSLDVNRPGEHVQPVIDATLAMLEDGLEIRVKRSTFTTVAALLLSVLFQGIVYSIFGHVLATHSRDIEYIFAGKMQRLDVKKNFNVNT